MELDTTQKTDIATAQKIADKVFRRSLSLLHVGGNMQMLRDELTGLIEAAGLALIEADTRKDGQ